MLWYYGDAVIAVLCCVLWYCGDAVIAVLCCVLWYYGDAVIPGLSCLHAVSRLCGTQSSGAVTPP